MDTPLKKAIKALESRFPGISGLFTEKMLLWILAVFLVLAGTFTNISSGSAIVIGLGIVLIILALIDPKTIKKLSSKWFSLERHQYSEEERQAAVQSGQKEVSPEIKQKLDQIADEAKKRKDEERAPEDYLVLANEAWDKKKYEEGLQLAYTGLQLESKDKRTLASLYNVLGINYSMLDSYLLAEKNYKKAIEIDKTFHLPHYNLGVLYKSQKKDEEAEKAYQKALELNSRDVLAYNNLGVLYSDQRKYEKAEKAFKRALKLNPNAARFHNNLGNLYSDQKKYEKAEKAYQKALELSPLDAIFHNNIGSLYIDQKKYDLAEISLNKALELDPDLKEALKNLEKVGKLRGEKEVSPGQPTLDLGKEKSKNTLN